MITEVASLAAAAVNEEVVSVNKRPHSDTPAALMVTTTGHNGGNVNDFIRVINGKVIDAEMEEAEPEVLDMTWDKQPRNPKHLPGKKKKQMDKKRKEKRKARARRRRKLWRRR